MNEAEIRERREWNERRKVEIAEKARERIRAEQPIIADLREVGVDVESVWQVYKYPESYPVIFPITLKHLERGGYPDRVMEWLARVMAVKEATPYWWQLRDLYLVATGKGEIEGLAAALAESARREHLDELIALLDVPTRNGSQIFFLGPIIRLGRERGWAIVEELKDHPVYGKEASFKLHQRELRQARQARQARKQRSSPQ
ncbi:MAG: hypothetical protein QM705_07430 [Ancrocorticia sp.]